MIQKKIISPDRLRRVPEGFGWVDHRLVREGRVRRHSPEALSLYLFLVTVADVDGVSWYSDESLNSYLNLDDGRLRSARRELVEGSLVAHQRPFYQVLEIPRPESAERRFQSVMKAALNAVESAPVEGPVHIGEAIDRLAGRTEE